MGYLKNKFSQANTEVIYLILSSYFKSLLVFYITPLYAAGAITEKEISNLEADMKRKSFGLQGDFKSETI